MTKLCLDCNHQYRLGNKFCSACGNPVNDIAFCQPTDLSKKYSPSNTMPDFSSEPTPELRNPQETFHSGDLSLRIEGEVVPVVDVHLGQQQSIYFEHHILLWKHPNVCLGVKGLKGAAKRFFAGLQIFISEWHWCCHLS